MIDHRPVVADIAANFQEVSLPFSANEATAEANRCLFCVDAPCTQACPTGIDVPMFIRKITTSNLKGAAKLIFDANPLGASCARVCPTEELCAGACVLNNLTEPIKIGRLQRYVTDFIKDWDIQLYQPGAKNGHKVAIVGGGPAGISAARELALLGYQVTIFEARGKAGGLNTYGVAPYRLPQDVALWEVEQVEQLGVEIRTQVVVGQDVDLEQLESEYDSVILAIGMGKTRQLGIDGESLSGVIDALDLIEQAKDGDPQSMSIGKRVAVIGAGNTAVDAATTAKRLGAEIVQILYRRTENEMTAYQFEYEFAKLDGIEFRWLTLPNKVIGADRVEGVECLKMRLGDTVENGRHRPVPIYGSEFVIPVDSVVLATGQSRWEELLAKYRILNRNGVITVNDDLLTSRANVYAAGDCTVGAGSNEATVVEAVQQGKKAAYAIHRQLTQKQNENAGGV